MPTPEMTGSQNAGSPSPFMTLPPEIIFYIAMLLALDRGPYDEFALSTSPFVYRYDLAQEDLASLASTCSSLRQILFPIIFLDMRISSPALYATSIELIVTFILISSPNLGWLHL